MQKMTNGYTWIPAGMDGNYQIELGINYKKRKCDIEFKLEIEQIDEHCQRISLLDRDIFINCKSRDKPFVSTDYDEIVNLDAFSENSSVNRVCGADDWVLCSAYDGINRNHYFNWAKEWGKLKMFADSGGYQVKVRRIDYLDPSKIIKWMNSAADVGAALDVAPRPDIDWGNKRVIELLSQGQAANNEVYAKKARNDLMLLNVTHGSEPEHIRIWIDTVRHERFDVGWAVGGNNKYDVIPGQLRAALILIKEYGITNWIHFFALGSSRMIPVMTYLGKKYRITSDSTSHLMGSKQRIYYEIDDEGKLYKEQISDRIKKTDISWMPLKCSCPVCSSVKYLDIFTCESKVVGGLLNWHNLFILKAYQNIWNQLAYTLPDAAYRDIVEANINLKSRKILDFIDYAICNGIDAASKEFHQLVSLDVAMDKNPDDAEDDDYEDADINDFDEIGEPGSNLEILTNFIDITKIKGLTQEERKQLETKGKQNWLMSYDERKKQINRDECRRNRMLLDE